MIQRYWKVGLKVDDVPLETVGRRAETKIIRRKVEQRKNQMQHCFVYNEVGFIGISTWWL